MTKEERLALIAASNKRSEELRNEISEAKSFREQNGICFDDYQPLISKKSAGVVHKTNENALVAPSSVDFQIEQSAVLALADEVGTLTGEMQRAFTMEMDALRARIEKLERILERRDAVGSP